MRTPPVKRPQKAPENKSPKLSRVREPQQLSVKLLGRKVPKPATPLNSEKPNLPAADGWLTRDQAIDMLGCSLQTLKNYETRHLLQPMQALRKDRGGVERAMLVYSPTQLAELPLRNGSGQPRIAVREPGETAARAFELFREGLALDEVVIELRETPERIDHLHEHWLDQTHARYVISKKMWQAFTDLVGEFGNVTELFELIRNRLA